MVLIAYISLALVAAMGVAANPVPDSPNKLEKCGGNVCKAGTYCCNESCGICAPKDGFCTQQFCESPIVKLPVKGECGPAICAEGLQCCNASCGYCVEPGNACTMEACLATS